MNETEIRIRGIDALNKALGLEDTFRFLTMFHQEPPDHAEICKRLYQAQTIDIKRCRKGRDQDNCRKGRAR